MCGIFGVISKNKKDYNKKVFKEIALISEARGKDSSGISVYDYNKKTLSTLKYNGSISELINNNSAKKLIENSIKSNNSFFAFGHSRLVTNGSQLKKENNQPVIKDKIACIHNGIITNVDQLYKKFPEIIRENEIDSEIIPSILSNFNEKNESIEKTFDYLNQNIEGTISSAIFPVSDSLLLYTNNGSLYYLTNEKDFFVFASEKYFLKKLIKKAKLKSFTDEILTVNKVKLNELVKVDINNLRLRKIKFKKSVKFTKYENSSNYNFNQEFIANKNDKKSMVINPEIFQIKSTNYKQILQYNYNEIKELKRCTKCILPETFPYIDFDEKGVCNYCNNYVPKNQVKPFSVLDKLVAPYRSGSNSKADVLIPFSGGRDSTFVLHYVKQKLGLNPIAYTYDWGMLTDLGRRNIARTCGSLGVENIIVAADIKKKRRNIKLNIEAWLKNPHLGMIPLFMAGDKQFFKYANIIKKQNNIKLNIWGINFLENTDFKVGFSGVKPEWNKEMIYSLSAKRKLKLFSFVAKNIIKNPYYINISNLDTIDSFLSRYLNPREDYYHFFDYYAWNESEINDLIINNYNWEKAKDLKSTWRIGDGTASFYNYIYFTVAGFSEFDTFRSNQIREGMISREYALDIALKENFPRYQSLRWYLEIIGLDFSMVIKKVNSIKKLY